MEFIGYYKNGEYQNIYGKRLSCFKCDSNECNGSKDYSLLHGGNAEILHCKEHEQDARDKAESISTKVTISHTNQSNT